MFSGRITTFKTLYRQTWLLDTFTGQKHLISLVVGPGMSDTLSTIDPKPFLLGRNPEWDMTSASPLNNYLVLYFLYLCIFLSDLYCVLKAAKSHRITCFCFFFFFIVVVVVGLCAFMRRVCVRMGGGCVSLPYVRCGFACVLVRCPTHSVI